MEVCRLSPQHLCCILRRLYSSFVGLAVMLILIPVPTWVASLMQDVQKQKMEAVSAKPRVETALTDHSGRLMLVYKGSRKVSDRQ